MSERASPLSPLPAGHSGAGLTPNVHFFRPHIFKRVLLRHGYVRVTANATHLTHAAVASDDGSLMDEFTLTKPPGWRPAERSSAGTAAAAGGGARVHARLASGARRAEPGGARA